MDQQLVLLTINVLLQMLNELKQRSLGNSEKEEKMEVKKKTMDLLPDADNNLVQLQVGPVSGRWCDRSGWWTQRFLFLFVTAACGGDQCEASGESGCPVGKTPRSTHPGASQTEGNVQPPRCESPHANASSVSMATVPSDFVICGSVAGIFQEAVRNQDFA